MEGKIFDVAALGESLIDFTPCGVSDNGMRLFEQNPGGAPMNMLTAVSRSGLKTAFIGKVGNDMHGRFLVETAESAGIDPRGMVIADDVFTTLAFVTLSESGERSFSFARKPGADTMLRFDEVDRGILESTKVFHVGSLSLTDEPARESTIRSAVYADGHGAVISYDPNYRAPLWNSVDEAKEGMKLMLPYTDIMKLSDEETSLLTPYSEPEKAADYLLGLGIKLVAVTLGSRGALVCTPEGMQEVPGFRSSVVDTTGAGDSFWGGFVSRLIKSGLKPDEVSLSEAAEFARYGNAVASLCVEGRGGITSIPFEDAVIRRLGTL